MTRTTIYIILVSVIPLIAYPQGEISKQEIYSYWIKNNNSRERPFNYRIRLDSVVVVLIDKLKDSGIDTLGVYEEDYVGADASDSCMCETIPWIAYVQWIDNGLTYQQKVTKYCEFMPIQIDYSALISYYISTKTKISKGRIMPVITGASRNKKGDISLNIQMIDHTVHYSIYCDLNGKSRFTTFEQFEIENEKNLFYRDNLNSAINKWRKMIENQIKEVESE